MNLKMGNLLFWIANAAAALLIGLAGFVLVSDEVPNRYSVATGIAVSAAFVWLVGRAALYILARR